MTGASAAEKEARASGFERELKVEREWRTSLQESSIANIEKISQLNQEIEQLKKESEVMKKSSINNDRFLIFYRLL